MDGKDVAFFKRLRHSLESTSTANNINMADHFVALLQSTHAQSDVGMASLSMRFRVDADFFQDAARVDVDFFSTAKKIFVFENTRLRVDIAKVAQHLPVKLAYRKSSN